MDWMDFTNGLFEFMGGCLVWLSIRSLWQSKTVAGVHWGPVLFFWAWGVWNLGYYPSLDQWWSFAGGLWIVLSNLIWLVLMVVYWPRNNGGTNEVQSTPSQ